MFTLAQAARHLHMGEKTLLELAKDEKVPATLKGKSWVFKKSALDAWVESHRAAGDVDFDSIQDGMKMPLGDLLTDDGIIADLRATDALGVIEEVAARAYSRSWLKNKPWFIGALVDREALASTAMEGGVAFLHTRERDHGKISRPFVVLGRSYQGVEFGAPDGNRTYLFFLLGLTSDRLHLPILGRLARILKNSAVVSKLRATSSPTVMRSLLLKEDDKALKGMLAPPLQFPDKPLLNREIRKRAIMRVALKQREDERKATKTTPKAAPGKKKASPAPADGSQAATKSPATAATARKKSPTRTTSAAKKVTASSEKANGSAMPIARKPPGAKARARTPKK
jgi:excisionase family DNA binding protein